MDDSAMFGALCSDDPEGESFEQLFEKFRLMKGKPIHFHLGYFFTLLDFS